MSDQVQLVKDKLNIVDVIGGYVKLNKAGKNYKGLSPFNKEKTPSFFVSPDKGMYYDFSSGQGGDIFSFIEVVEGVDFRGALQILADKAGVELKKESKESRDERDKQYEIIEKSNLFFESNLKENKKAIKYLKDRGIEEETITSFRLGFALNEWQSLYDHLKNAGYTEDEIEKAGLIKKGDKGKYYDRFRSRIIFPIMDSAGRVVAYSGRIFGEPANDEKNAKYLNSPETQLFNKSRILFGYDKAKQFIRKYNFTILVEGQMDLVMSHQCGYGNTVAVSGTGLTNEHISLIERLSKNVVIAFDADSSGIASSGRASTLSLQHGLDVKIAEIPEGKDPADCMLEDIDIWKTAIRVSKHAVDFFLDLVLKEAKENNWDNRKIALSARDRVYPFISLIKSATDKAHFVKNVSDVLGIAEEAVWSDVNALPSQHTRATVYTPQKNTTENVSFSRKNDLEKALAGILFSESESDEKRIIDDDIQKTAKKYNINLEQILAQNDDEKKVLSLQAEVTHPKSENLLQVFTNMCIELAKINTSDELSSLIREQKNAERNNDKKTIESLEKKVQTLSKFKNSLEVSD
jgi:DNA primase